MRFKFKISLFFGQTCKTANENENDEILQQVSHQPIIKLMSDAN